MEHWLRKLENLWLLMMLLHLQMQEVKTKQVVQKSKWAVLERKRSPLLDQKIQVLRVPKQLLIILNKFGALLLKKIQILVAVSMKMILNL